MEYPKIETLFYRNPETFKVIFGKFRLPEFDLPKRWLVTEKIDGTNIRVHLHSDGSVTYGGRTDNAQLFAPLVAWLQANLSPDKVSAAFDPETEAILFGEGYGPKIQKGGIYRKKDVAFRLFDVAVFAANRVWWLNWENVCGVARKCGVETVPILVGGAIIQEAVSCLFRVSRVAQDEGGVGGAQEGIVCRTEPLLFTRSGQRVMWKLKGKDL